MPSAVLSETVMVMVMLIAHPTYMIISGNGWEGGLEIPSSRNEMISLPVMNRFYN